MKILLATSKAIPSGGGIASYNQELVNLLGSENEVYLLTDADENDVLGYRKTFRTYGNSNTDYDYCSRLVRKIDEASYDCIINSASSFLPVIAPFLEAKIVSVSHFVNGKLAINAGYNADYQSAIVALSEYGKRFIESKFNTSPSLVKVLYNFVPLYTTPRLSKIEHTPLRIVYPGGTSIKKSVDVVQALVYRLLKSNLDFEFYWLGGTILPSSKFSLFGLHTTNDLFPSDSRLKITGIIPREEAMRIMESANIFILPSRGEGCPMTLLEAMRGGCIPIVSDAHHGSRELLEKSKVGFVVRQGSSVDLFRVISKIISNHAKFHNMYMQSYEFLRDNLSQDLWGRKMREIIACACDGQKKCIPLTKEAFKKSSTGFAKLNQIERLKDISKSAFYRVKFDICYLLDKIGRFKKH